MEKFWAVILIFAIVAAGGLLYVNQVYEPQKDAQVAMARTASQTLTVVTQQMDNDDTPRFVKGEDVIREVGEYCDTPNNTVTITVIVNGIPNVYKAGSGDIADKVGSEDKTFVRTPYFKDGELEKIEFREYKSE